MRSASGGRIASDPSVGGLSVSVVEVASGAKVDIVGGRDLAGPIGRFISPECRLPDSKMDSVSSAEVCPESPEMVAAESDETLSLWM